MKVVVQGRKEIRYYEFKDIIYYWQDRTWYNKRNGS